jgi:hypothetical protein
MRKDSEVRGGGLNLSQRTSGTFAALGRLGMARKPLQCFSIFNFQFSIQNDGTEGRARTADPWIHNPVL